MGQTPVGGPFGPGHEMTFRETGAPYEGAALALENLPYGFRCGIRASAFVRGPAKFARANLSACPSLFSFLFNFFFTFIAIIAIKRVSGIKPAFSFPVHHFVTAVTEPSHVPFSTAFPFFPHFYFTFTNKAKRLMTFFQKI